MTTLPHLAALLLTVFACLSQAAQPASPQTLESGLAGRWSGALEYRDYQSNRSFKLPVVTVIGIGPDAATLTRLSSFDDGPQTGIVHTTTVSLFDKTGSSVTSAMFRKGRAVETWTEAVRISAYQDALNWVLVYQRRGQDGNSAADIRITQTRRGAELTALKEVKTIDAPDSAYALRNQTVLTLQATP